MERNARGLFAAALIVLSIAVGGEETKAQTRERQSLRERAARVEPLMRAAAREYGVDPRLLWTIAYLESRFQSHLISPKNARGMMQFIPATAARFNLIKPHDDAQAVRAAARYVRYLAGRFDNRLDLVLAGYNAGEGAVDAYLRGISLRLPDGRTINPRRLQTGGVPPYAETRGYVVRGLQIMRAVAQANVFASADLVTVQTLVAPPPQAPNPVRRTSLIANPPAPVSPASSPQTIAPQTEPVPASRYAVGDTSRRTVNEDAVSLSEPAQTNPAVRSFRASAITSTATANEPIGRGESIERAPAQPRSVRAGVQAMRR